MIIQKLIDGYNTKTLVDNLPMLYDQLRKTKIRKGEFISDKDTYSYRIDIWKNIITIIIREITCNNFTYENVKFNFVIRNDNNVFNVNFETEEFDHVMIYGINIRGEI